MDARQRLNQKRKQTKGGPKGQKAGGVRGRGVTRATTVAGKGARKQPVKGAKRPGAGKPGNAGQSPRLKPVITKTKSGVITVTRPVKDLRQLIGTKPKTAAKAKTTVGQKKSQIQARLGLQSKSALTAQRKGVRNVSRAQDNQPRITISNPSTRGPSGTISRIRGGASGSQLSRNRVWRRSDVEPQMIFPQNNSQAPTIFLSTQPMGNVGSPISTSSLGQSKGNSVVVSNLRESISQHDLLELFGDVGTMSSFTKIDDKTAMISYSNASDASRAVQTYHNRLLDGAPMQCTLIPSPAIADGNLSGGGSRHVRQAFQQALRSSR